MDFAKLAKQVTDYAFRQDQKRIEEEIKRTLIFGRGLADGATNVANILHASQTQQAIAQNQQSNFNQYHPGNLGSLPVAQANWSPAPLGSHAPYDMDGEHVTQGILKSFELKDKATYEFATATAQLLSARIRASWSPNRSPRCTPRKGIVWQLFNHNWMVDVQWVGDSTGGSEEEWTKRFAELADLISEARANGDKQYGDEPEHTLTSVTIQRAQQMLGLAAQQAQYGGLQAQQALHGHALSILGLGNVSSQSGVTQGGGYSSTGGNSAETTSLGNLLGMGP